MIAYKVVGCYNGEYFSYMYHSLTENNITPVQYIPGSFVSAVVFGTPLYVFKTVDNALEFVPPHFGISGGRTQVWEVEVQGRFLKPMLLWNQLFHALDCKKRKKRIPNGDIIPTGTIMVKEVKLIKRII